MTKQLLAICSLAVGIFSIRAIAQVPPNPCAITNTANGYQLPDRFSYAAKFLCGSQTSTVVFDPNGTVLPFPNEPPVKAGNYATVINIHNPYANDLQLCKKVVLASPETFPNTKLIQPTRRYPDTLPTDITLSVDCKEIVSLLKLSNISPPAFIEGFVVIDAFAPLGAVGNLRQDIDVVTVTTSSGLANPFSFVPNVPTPNHEITTVIGKPLAAGLWIR